jgi:hypothetical protein
MCISKMVLDNYKYIPVSISNNALRDLTLIKMAVTFFVGTGSFSISYSSGHMK